MISKAGTTATTSPAGANAVSLRGLTVQKTLTVFDGLRMAPYPLADDGHRNFVDLSTIPDAVVERVEVLKDGASSTYGADAVAGVVNIITLRELQGLHVNASAGITKDGDGGEQRLDASYGIGDLSGRRLQRLRRRALPQDRRDLGALPRLPVEHRLPRRICNDAAPAAWRPPTRWYEFASTRTAARRLDHSGLPARRPRHCRRRPHRHLPAAQHDCGAFGALPQTLPTARRRSAPRRLDGRSTYATNICQKDTKQAYATLRPETERYGFAARATVHDRRQRRGLRRRQLDAREHLLAADPSALRRPRPRRRARSRGTVVLPVYVCPAWPRHRGTASTPARCTAARRATLNPNNPFAAAGQTAILRGRYDRRRRSRPTPSRGVPAAASRARSAAGRVELRRRVHGVAGRARPHQRELHHPAAGGDVIAPAVQLRAAVAQHAGVCATTSRRSTQDLDLEALAGPGTVGHDLFELPGGMAKAAVGLSYRENRSTTGSANPENLAHPYDPLLHDQRGRRGRHAAMSSRRFAEVGLPIVDQLEVNLSGRYDDYSSGQSNFSPKIARSSSRRLAAGPRHVVEGLPASRRST
jgi:iron complex outermembrane receptor protein